MTLPQNFPLTDEQLNSIDARLASVEAYKGVGIAAPLRDLRKIRGGMQWLLNRHESLKNDKATLTAQKLALTNYLAAVEAVLQAYASGTWDGGTAANSLMNNLPQIQ
jgi:hypothetical protein